MWKKIKRILKMALLFPVLIAFAKGTYEDAPDPELLTTPSQEGAIAGLEELAYGELPTLPTLEPIDVPDLPTMSLEDIEPYNIGMDEIKKVLGDAYDPFKSPFYQGLREASMREEEAGISKLRRRSQMGRMVQSDPSRRTEAEYRGGMGTGRTMMLGEMYETERGRKAEQIPNLLNYAGFAGDIGKFNTQIGIQQAMLPYEQELIRAQINQQTGIDQALLPYTAQAPIMEGLAGGYGTWHSPEQIYQPGLLDYAAPVIGGLLSIF